MTAPATSPAESPVARGGAVDPATGARVAVFGAMLATAGLPLYIHLPVYAGQVLGLPLATLGVVLMAMRLFDLAQDPFLGRLTDRLALSGATLARLSALGLAAGFLMLFVAPMPGLAWLVAALMLLFTAFSLATILLYGRGVAIGGGRHGQLALAGWREAGIIAGIVLAAALPDLLGRAVPGAGAWRVFGVVLAALCLVALAVSRGLWSGPVAPAAPLTRAALSRSGAGGLIALAFVNALPVAFTSTLFLFFVGDYLRLPGMAGVFLILFFVAAGLSAPLWSRLARRAGARPTLIAGMALAVAAFVFAGVLQPGDAVAFAAISAASGAALGADMVILPALFSAALARAGLAPGLAFGLWSLAGKAALGLAAGVALPLLQIAGFEPGGDSPARAMGALLILYAGLPCILKLGVILWVARHPLDGESA
ncbi:Na+/melibiose symporter-like transporter [Albidovulum inexpectatum]|uniref:Na+/melibiose symporter-like transporter n=1 Tax=Albidovulum inexpectatum TaxID=196587 RepID=A0A2S5JHC4_9RHOB|nr:MFS transporter [Albidovulum inexpectatum]PPB80768.1 Na+/melibiose symporter-like transporter [Albidovulum inexpectatum]